MLRRVLLALMLSPLIACAQSEAPAAAAVEAPAAAAPAAAAPAAAATAATVATAPAAAPAAPAASDVATTAATGAADVATTAATAEPAPFTGEIPRPGKDYEVLETPQPTWGRGKIEVAEVFGYTCIHCAHLQPELNIWHKTMAKDIRFEYVPAAFGGAWDTLGRAYFAAEAMGVREKTHDAIFNAIHVDHVLKTASDEEVADLYASFGVDRERFLATMKSFGVDAKLAKARQFALRGGVSGTPTMIINGKYRVNVTPDRGFKGMLSTVDYLVSLERSGQAAPAGAP
jgi:thiol:disulfide interchange protein DsbA